MKVIVSGDVCGEITNVVDVTGANEPAANVGPDNHAEATDQIACVPRIRLQKGGPDLAHVGDAITYVFVVTNAGGVDLSDIRLSDPKCDAGSITVVEDGNGNDVLEVGEAWDLECTHTITAGDGDPVHNEASVSGDHEGGTVSDSAAHDVAVLHPGIDLEKTATPTAGPAGTLITYTYSVTNNGDTPLFDISVDDDMVGHVGDIPTLAVGGTVRAHLPDHAGLLPHHQHRHGRRRRRPRGIRERRRRRNGHRGGRRRRRDRGRKPIHRIRNRRARLRGSSSSLPSDRPSWPRSRRRSDTARG